MLLLVALASARTWVVDPAGAGDVTTITAAVAVAAAGDEIDVRAGEYRESVVVTRAIVLRGVDGAAVTTISSTRSAPSLRISAAASVEGLTFTHTDATAIRIDAASPTFTDVIVAGSGDLDSSEGSAVLVMGGSPVFERVTFRDNRGFYGAHLYVSDGAEVSVVDSTLEAGLAIQGGAVRVEPACTLTLTGSVLRDNESYGSGGALQLQGGSTAVLVDTELEGNTTSAAGGAAIGVMSNATLSVTGGRIADNAPQDWANQGHPGALYLNAAHVSLAEVELSGNAGASGGALYAVDAELDLSGVTLRDNQATSGGAAWLYRTGLADYASDWSGNRATTAAGGLYASLSILDLDAVALGDNVAGTDGGGLYLDASTFELASGALTGNVAGDQGGGGYSQGSTVRLDGVQVGDNRAGIGGGYASVADLVLATEALDVRDNSAGTGGGFAVVSTPSWSDLDSRWTGNHADDSGGAGWASGVVVLLEGPVVEGSVALFGDGGSFAVEGGSLEVDAGRFDDAVAAWDGGHLHVTGGPLVVRDTRFAGGVAVYGEGGGVWTDSGVQGLRVRFDGNDAARGAGVAQLGGVEGDRWENLALVENVGSAVLVRDHPGVALVQADILGHSVGVEATDATVELRDVLLGWNDLGVSLVGGALQGGWNAWWANGADVGGDLGSVPGEGNLAADPRLPGFVADGVAGDGLVPAADSPLLDAGDPTRVDPDGSRADIGVTGGPEAGWVDLDGDGSPSGLDCDDTDAEVFPGAPESAYDGVDHDCDGLDLDADGDGHDATEAGGDDCDDADPARWERCDGDTAPDPDSGGDSGDTGVEELPKVEVAPCGCAGRLPAFAGVVLLSGLLRRRRAPTS